jgi:hypothetical protein
MHHFTRLTNAFSKTLENHAAMVSLYFMYYNFAGCITRSASRRRWRLESPTMSGPSKKSSPHSGDPEQLRMYVERLYQAADEFRKTIDEELRTISAQLLFELRVRHAKRPPPLN